LTPPDTSAAPAVTFMDHRFAGAARAV